MYVCAHTDIPHDLKESRRLVNIDHKLNINAAV